MSVRKSFKLKLIFSYILVGLISLSFITFFLDKKLEDSFLSYIQHSLVNQAKLIEAQIPPVTIKEDNQDYLAELAKSLSLKINCRLTIINKQGKVLADSDKAQKDIFTMENHLSRPEISSALNGVLGIQTRYSSTLMIDMLYVALPIKDQNQVIGVLRLALPLVDIKTILSTIRGVIIIGFFFSLALAFVFGSLAATAVVKPIKQIIEVSRRFSRGDFSRRIRQSSQDEIGELVTTLNKMAQDIEDKIKETQAQNQKLNAIFNSMIEAAVVVDKSGYIISINPAVEKIFSVEEEKVKGKLFLEVLRNNDIFEIINGVLKNGKPLSKEISLDWPVYRIFQINAVAIVDNGTIGGCLVVIHDITEIRKLENIRRDFVANVSHELKTPLTSIKGFVETLLEGALDDRANNRNFLNIIKEHTERLDGLVNDLLVLSHIESKEISLEKSNILLCELLNQVILGFKSQLKKKNIEIINELPVGLSVEVDKNRIEQVFINLIDNAVKFNKENGSIKISSQEVDGSIKISIEDTGMGIPQKDIPRIFERFYRVDKARSRQLGGTGLGLSIVKHIIELHQGNVGVESVEGFGSKFWFTLLR